MLKNFCWGFCFVFWSDIYSCPNIKYGPNNFITFYTTPRGGNLSQYCGNIKIHSTLVWPNQIYINESAKVFILAFFLRQELKEPQCPSFNFGTKFSIFIFINHIFKLFSQNSLRSLTLGVTNSHEYMKYMEYDELSWEWGFVTYLSYLSIFF